MREQLTNNRAEKSKEDIVKIIKQELSHLNQPPFNANIEYFLKTGRINGSLLIAIELAADKIVEGLDMQFRNFSDSNMYKLMKKREEELLKELESIKKL